MVARTCVRTIENDHQLRVIVALDMQLHRDAIGQAIALKRPEWLVRQVHPDQLAELILDCAPDVVICTSLADGIESQVPMCVLLHPEDSTGSIVSWHEQQVVLTGFGLSELLTVMDKVYG
jgi:hypothetical protein